MTTLETLDQIESLPVQVTYVGKVFRSDWGKDGAEVDQWRVKITGPAGFHCLDYFTGMGLRAKTYSGFGRKYDAMRKKHYDDKPQKPKVADVMHSLIMDASAADQNFNEWCANYGYSDDSIKAMNIYKQCLETAQALHKHLGRTTVARLRELLEDY